MNVRIVAALLQMERELEQIEGTLKRQQEWRSARKISNVRAVLAKALTDEQESLSSVYTRYQQTLV